MGFFESVGSVFSKYFEFSGRALRSEYWYFMLFSILFGIVVGILDVVFFSSFMGEGPLSLILTLAFLFPSITVAARRLHDSGRSGWWQLLAFTIIGIPVVLYWYIKQGDQSENKFGMPPIGSKSNHSSAARAARSTDSSPSESRAARAARSSESSPSESSPSEPSPSESRAARAARSSAASLKNPPDEPAKKDSSQENPSKDISSEADDLYFDNRRKK